MESLHFYLIFAVVLKLILNVTDNSITTLFMMLDPAARHSAPNQSWPPRLSVTISSGNFCLNSRDARPPGPSSSSNILKYNIVMKLVFPLITPHVSHQLISGKQKCMLIIRFLSAEFDKTRIIFNFQ